MQTYHGEYIYDLAEVPPLRIDLTNRLLFVKKNVVDYSNGVIYNWNQSMILAYGVNITVNNISMSSYPPQSVPTTDTVVPNGSIEK